MQDKPHLGIWGVYQAKVGQLSEKALEVVDPVGPFVGWTHPCSALWPRGWGPYGSPTCLIIIIMTSGATQLRGVFPAA